MRYLISYGSLDDSLRGKTWLMLLNVKPDENLYQEYLSVLEEEKLDKFERPMPQ